MPDEFVTPCINKDYLTLPYLTGDITLAFALLLLNIGNSVTLHHYFIASADHSN